MEFGKSCIRVILLIAFLCSCSSDGWSQLWSPLEELSFAPPSFGGKTTPPQIGVDKKGNAFAVWASKEPLGDVIKASRFDSETGEWSFPKRISLNDSHEPRLAVTHDGKAIVVWEREIDGRGVLLFTVYQNDWADEQIINDHGLLHDSYPSVAVDELGNALIVWQSQVDRDGRGSLAVVIHSSTYCFETSTFGPVLEVSKNRTLENFPYVGQPEVAINASGQAIAIWRYYDGGTSKSPYRIQSNTYRNGVWEGQVDVSTSPTAQLILPTIAISPKGEGLAIWVQTGMHYYVVTAAVKTKEWGSLTALSSLGYALDSFDNRMGSIAHATFDHEGHAIAAWTFADESFDPPQYKVQAKSYQNSQWSKTSNLSDSGIFSASVRVAFDGQGNGWAVFAARDFSFDTSQDSFSILASRFIKGLNVWCVAECLSVEPNNFLPNISTNFKGQFHSIWVAEKQKFGILQSAGWEADLPSSPPPPPVLLPLPPKNGVGHQTKNEFASHTNRINVITWERPNDGSVPVSYRIYRDEALKEMIAEIPAHGVLKYSDPNRKKGKEYTYFLITVDQHNHVSSPIRIVVHPAK